MAKKRRDINTLNDNEIADYIHALDILRARSEVNPDDETGYAFQAGLHNDPFIGPCEHGNDRFLAWHRSHLHYFEKLLQESDPPRTANVTIPYWDWIHPETSGKFPSAFNGPGLFMPGRNVTPNPSLPPEILELMVTLPPNTLEIVTTLTDWNAFGGYPEGDPNGDYGALEQGRHNRMHGFFIGGRMDDPTTAAEDPIYWSFHAFIDLLWAEWQRRNNMPPPTSPEDNLRGFLTKPKHKIKDFQRTTDLDYEYEYTDKLREAFGVDQTVLGPRELLAMESLRPLFTDGLESELRNAARVRFAIPSPPAATVTAVIRLRNLKVPTTGSYLLRAYVHPKDLQFNKDDPEFRRKYGVGYVALWKAHGTGHAHNGHGGHGHHAPQPHHPTSCTVRFDVSKTLSGILVGATSDLVLTLHYTPAPNTIGTPQFDPELVKEVQLDDVLLEAYRQL